MGYVEENAAARARVLGLVGDLSAEALAAPAEGGWTLAGLLAHMAFWERVHIGRLRRAVDAGLGAPPPLPDGVPDIVNGAAIPSWLTVPGREAVRVFDEASADADRYLAGLDPAVVEGVRVAGYPRVIERFRQRTEHGDAIAAALARTS
jgi:hypothetical protein